MARHHLYGRDELLPILLGKLICVQNINEMKSTEKKVETFYPDEKNIQSTLRGRSILVSTLQFIMFGWKFS